jgi:predicted N-acetyltransferase YhbS
MGTLPQHQRKGAASLLMTEFCKQTDAEGHWGYLEASPMGRPTYERFGFETRDEFSTLVEGGAYVNCCMVREPRVG